MKYFRAAYLTLLFIAVVVVAVVLLSVQAVDVVINRRVDVVVLLPCCLAL